MIRLGVNIDHVATIRQARRGDEPDPVAAALCAILAGADGITLHLREDRRHIQDHDVRRMRESIKQRMNLEMAVTEEMISIALSTMPDEATLVPEKREELTTEGGLDIIAHYAKVSQAVTRLQSAGIIVSLFIDPDEEQVRTAAQLGAQAIELQTATYSEAKSPDKIENELHKLHDATACAVELGLHVHLGHGLNYHNVQPLVSLPGIEEMNIGHSIISRAVLVGMDRAVRDMKSLLNQRD